MSNEIELVAGISQVDAQAWDALTDGSPLLSHAFLSALEDTGCVGEGTGWQPYPLLVRDAGKLVGAMPLYLKGHSYGEYVFDWAWAEAYARNGLAYYPKLLAAIPFTPITGARLLSHDAGIQSLMVQVLDEQMQRHRLSSAHILFPDDASAEALKKTDWIERSGVQFRWENENFTEFEDFLSCLAHDKRKKIRQERKKITAAGIICKKLKGGDITEAEWDFFFRCYENTYHEHRSTPYLTREFFHVLGERMPQHTLLVIAEQAGEPIAAALNLYGQDALFGGPRATCPACTSNFAITRRKSFVLRKVSVILKAVRRANTNWREAFAQGRRDHSTRLPIRNLNPPSRILSGMKPKAWASTRMNWKSGRLSKILSNNSKNALLLRFP